MMKKAVSVQLASTTKCSLVFTTMLGTMRAEESVWPLEKVSESLGGVWGHSQML